MSAPGARRAPPTGGPCHAHVIIDPADVNSCSVEQVERHGQVLGRPSPLDRNDPAGNRVGAGAVHLAGLVTDDDPRGLRIQGNEERLRVGPPSWCSLVVITKPPSCRSAAISVCPRDTRSKTSRRSDSSGALSARPLANASFSVSVHKRTVSLRRLCLQRTGHRLVPCVVS